MAGVGVVDATWHVGAGAGQYTAKEPPIGGSRDGVDPHAHSLAQRDSYGVASRLTMRAIVVHGSNGERVALVKSDLYLAQDLLLRRVGQLLAEAGSRITADRILHSASHNHSSPYYSTPSWGVWLFQDVMDLRNFEYTARAMADAILAAEADLRPARMGATAVHHDVYKGNIAGRGVADDGTPYGYPLDFGDHEVVVMRFDDISGDEPRPLAVWANWGQHPESLPAYDLISADFLGPLARFVERDTGAPLVFSQGDVGSAEGPYLRSDTPQLPDGTWWAWAHVGHAQTERGARLLADAIVEGWHRIATGEVEVPFSTDVPVAALTYWAPGPVSHPYPSVSNCRTGPTAEGNPGVPIVGLPDCQRTGQVVPVPLAWESLKLHGIPLPEHYDAPSFTGVQENLRLKLQTFRIGEVLLASCACEPQVDLILNIKTRADTVQGNIWNGFPWDQHCDDNSDGTWSCPHPGAGDLSDRSLTVDDGPFQRMRAQIHNDARGWDDVDYAPFANSEPADPAAIKGNFTHEELPEHLGYALPVALGHSGDYNGYTVSYREYMARDHYRKALTSHGPHTADYMATRLVRMAGHLKGGPPVPLEPLLPLAAVDEARQEATAQALGRAAGAAYELWRATLPDDVGPAEALDQPLSITRFDAATFTWRGGSNAVDNPTVAVERRVGEEWVPFADQSGEVQTILTMPEGVAGVADTHTGRQEWIWTASFEAFNAFPARLGQVPDGEYRFVVNGRIRQGGADRPYELVSSPFTVRPWEGITVRDLRVEPGGHVSFVVDPIAYPRTYDSPIEMVRDDGDPRICRTCSFRPWASTAAVDSATVAVLGPGRDGPRTLRRLVPAHPVGDRWSAPTRLRGQEIAVIFRGAVVDEWGERNGAQLAVARDGSTVELGPVVVTGAAGAAGGDPGRAAVDAPAASPVSWWQPGSWVAAGLLVLVVMALVAHAGIAAQRGPARERGEPR